MPTFLNTPMNTLRWPGRAKAGPRRSALPQWTAALALLTCLTAGAQTTPGTGAGTLSGPDAGTVPGTSPGMGANATGGPDTLGAENLGRMSPQLRNQAEAHMRAMQDLRGRMQAAATPEERQTLMQEHLRLMDESMALMHQMMGVGPQGGPQGGPPMGMPPQGGGMGGGMGPGSDGRMGPPGSVR